MTIPDVPLVDHLLGLAWVAGIALVALVKFVGVVWCIKIISRFVAAYEKKH